MPGDIDAWTREYPVVGGAVGEAFGLFASSHLAQCFQQACDEVRLIEADVRGGVEGGQCGYRLASADPVECAELAADGLRVADIEVADRVLAQDRSERFGGA